MRNTQLDQSVPGPQRGQETLPHGQTTVPIRYLPPLLVTLAAALFLVLLFALLSYLAGSVAGDNLFGPQAVGLTFSTGACGLVTLLLVGATLYFANATRQAARDLRAQPVTCDGVIVQRHSGIGRNSQADPLVGNGVLPLATRGGRRRGGGNSFWIVVGQADAQATASARVDLTPATPPAAAEPVRPRGFVQGSGDWAAQLQQDARSPAPSAAEEPLTLPPPPSRRPLGAGEVNLRVDKHVYQALAVGDRVQVVYSPYLQHVYYVRRQTAGGEMVILRNLALI